MAADFSAYGVNGSINGQNITIDLSGQTNCSTTVENMVIGINANGASISPDPRVARDYSQPVQFTLTAPDGTKVVYTVTVKGAACLSIPTPAPTPTPIPTPTPTPDTTPPVITVLGANPLSLTVGTAYTEAGATCVDNKDTSCTVTTTGAVNTAAVGAYTITYTATDAAGNVSSMNRAVNVVAVIVPTVSFAQTSYSVLEGATITNPLITNSPGVVTYSSGDTQIATVNSSTGQVTILHITSNTATVTITASQAMASGYGSITLSYVVNVSCDVNFSPLCA